MTDKDYNIISKKVYNLDPKEYKAEEQFSVGKESDVNGRKFRVIDAIGNSIELNYDSM